MVGPAEVQSLIDTNSKEDNRRWTQMDADESGDAG